MSRSDEAKALGVGMAAPYFKNKDLIEKNGVAVFSSNYNLYGDLSWRVMETLRIMFGAANVEVYSVDEAFVDLNMVSAERLNEVAKDIKKTVEMWTGIKVSVGVAPTKVLAKVANRLSKKDTTESQGVMVLDTKEKEHIALRKTKVDAIWGVGRQYAEKLQRYNIYTAYELSEKSVEWANKYLGGVTGARLVRELKGITSMHMEEELTQKKMIMTTRMFGEAVHDFKDIREAVATYVSRAAEKLRRQNGAAKTIGVFLVAKEQSHNTSYNMGATISSYVNLPRATSLTHEMLTPALEIAERLYEKGNSYKKAGVMLSHIVPDTSIQGNLFLPDTKNRGRLLMDMIDNINFSQRNDVLKYASSGTERNWKMQQNFNSPKYTSRWHELKEIE